MKIKISTFTTHLDGIRPSIALNACELETGAKDKKSENAERVLKATGQGLLFTD
jgi:hypothetical protein